MRANYITFKAPLDMPGKLSARAVFRFARTHMESLDQALDVFISVRTNGRPVDAISHL